MSKRDGGSAFPRRALTDTILEDGSGAHGWQEGMSLRDYFAGQALAGMNALPVSTNPAWQKEVESRGGVSALRAKCAYADADAMIAERDK